MKDSGNTGILPFASEISVLLKKAIELNDHKQTICESIYTDPTQTIEKELDHLSKR